MKNILLLVMLVIVFGIIGGCGDTGGGSGVTSYEGAYNGKITANSSQTFSLTVDMANKVTGSFVSGVGTTTVSGILTDGKCSVTDSAGNLWRIEFTGNGKVDVMIGGKPGSGEIVPGSPIVATKLSFTNNMLAGHIVQFDIAPLGRIYSFALTGNVLQFNTVYGNWSVNPDGTLTVTLPTDSMTFRIVNILYENSNGKCLTANYIDSKTPTTTKGPVTILIRN
jgi:hypothetical protein